MADYVYPNYDFNLFVNRRNNLKSARTMEFIGVMNSILMAAQFANERPVKKARDCAKRQAARYKDSKDKDDIHTYNILKGLASKRDPVQECIDTLNRIAEMLETQHGILVDRPELYFEDDMGNLCMKLPDGNSRIVVVNH